MIQYILGGAVVVFLVLLVVGAVTGRVHVRGCCSIAEPGRDLRMRPLEGESVDGKAHNERRRSASRRYS